MAYRYRVSIDNIMPGHTLADEISQVNSKGKKVPWLRTGYVFKEPYLQIMKDILKEIGFYSVDIYSQTSAVNVHPFHVEITPRSFETISSINNIKEKAKVVKNVLINETKKIIENIKTTNVVHEYSIKLKPYEDIITDLFTDNDFTKYITIFTEYACGNKSLMTHSINVFFYTLLICSSPVLTTPILWHNVGPCALLHDIGYFNSTIDPHWINNNPFSEIDERTKQKYRLHIDKATDQLKNHIAEEYISVIRNHHSYLDGSGYHCDDNVPKLAQVLSAADTFDTHQYYILFDGRSTHKKRFEEYRGYVADGLSKKVNKYYYRKILSFL